MKRIVPLGLCMMLLSFNAFAQMNTTTTTTTTTDYTVNEPTLNPRFGIQARYWMPDLSGNVFVTDDNQTTNVDFENDLGLGDKGVPEVRLFVNTTPNSKIRATYFYLNSDGENDLSRTIVYDGQTYPVTARVESELKLHYFSLGWLWNFIHEDKYKVGLVIDIKGISADAKLEAPTLGLSNKQSFTGAAPVPGLSMEVNAIDNLSVFGEITALPAGHYGHFYDAEAGLKWNFVPNWYLSGGYRMIDVKVDYKDDSGKLKLHGPFAALIFKF